MSENSLSGLAGPRDFAGFPAGAMVATPIPDLFLTKVMPRIGNLFDLQAALLVLHLNARARVRPRHVLLEALEELAILVGIVPDSSTASRQEIVDSVIRLEALRLLDHVDAWYGSSRRTVLFVNDAEGRRSVKLAREGKLDLGQDSFEPSAAPSPKTKARIIDLYEQNMGLLTPLIAEQLLEAESLYPADWIDEAFRIALENNKRNWRYVRAVLERWAVEGKDSRRRR